MQKTVSQGFRLSPQQQHVWWAQRAEPSSAFTVQVRIDVDGALDRQRLAAALEKAVERHEILRTTFPLLPGLTVPVQSIEDSAGIDWSEQSLAGVPAAEREAALGRLGTGIREIPFDLGNGPLLRATLVTLDRERHALFLSQPALVADATSLDLLAAEIAGAYHGALLPGEVLQYADLTELLHEWQGSPAEEPGPAFWRQQDLSALVRVRLGEAGLPDGQPFRPEHVRREIPRAPVEEAVARLGTTVPLVLSAGWHAALHVATGEEEIVVGTLFDGRTCEELESALGPFARYLPVPARPAAGKTLEDLIRSLSATVAGIARRQDFFSSGQVEALLAGHRASGWPFGFDHRRLRELPAAPGVPGFALRDGYLGLDRFGARLSMLDDGRSLRADLAYDPALLPRGEAERLLERFSRVLDGLLAGAPLSEVDPLTPAERQRVLLDFNRTESAVPADLCAHHLFEERARLAPEAPALVHAGRTWTYAELDERAGRLARALRASGLGPCSLVGLCLERSPELVAAVLGILKSGAAYVPLDPGSPPDRLAWMVADAGLSLLLTEEPLRPRFSGIPVCTLPLAEDEIPHTETGPGPDPADLAYVIYTSGSTGWPKGVMVSHGNLVHYLLWARQAYRAAAGAGAPVHSAIGFDLTVTSLLVPLAAGTAVTLLDERRPVEALVEALRGADGFSLVKLTPAHLDVLQRELAPGEVAGRTRALVIGGEALRAESVALWREHAPDTRLINEYGPTEATVGCSVYEIAPGDAATGPVPIGRPITNTRLYVVGPGLQPVPPGAPGELWIGGCGLARGYLGQPALTASRFVPDPFAALTGRAGERLYRTGDLVRLRPEGELEFLGRLDDQLKIRGFRIEPGEIAAALTAHPKVREAAVVAREDDGGRHRLVAYVVPRSREEKPAASELRRHLETRLPDYMVPAAFVGLDVLPLTPNGKLDRRALPAPDPEGDGETPYAPPRTLAEEVLVEIWGQVLGSGRVGIDDHFFSLGGDSIRSLQILSLAQRRGLELTLQDVFQCPTVRSLSVRVRLPGQETDAAVESGPFSLLAAPDRALLPDGVEDAYPLAHLQSGMLFHSALAPETAVYHDLHSFRLRGRYDHTHLRAALEQTARRHPVLRTSFDLASFSEPLQLVWREVTVPLTAEDLRGLPPDEQHRAVSAWLEAERQRAFDESLPPLVRFHVQQLDEDLLQVTLSFHHGVLDGWSAASLLTELFQRYAARLRGEPVPATAPLTTTFREFVGLERASLASAETRGFWKRHLAGSSLAALPRWPGPETAAPRKAETLEVPLPDPVSDGLRRIARSAAVPLKNVLLGVHFRVSSWLSGQDDVVTGLVTHGRPERDDGDQVLGLFLNTLPLRLRLNGGTWTELAQAAFDLERESLPHRRFPIAEMQRAEGGRPLFESVFNFLHFHIYQSVGRAGGLDVQERTGYEETSFPLVVHFFLDPDASRLRLLLSRQAAEIGSAQAAAIGRSYLAALEAMASGPGSRSVDAPLLSAAERHQLLAEWNDTAAEIRGESILACIEEQADRTPGAVAVTFEAETLTYEELDAAANRLAHRLRSLGVGPESLVAVAMERSRELVVALLGTLKAGAAYVPLEPTHPRHRLAAMLADCGPRVLLTQEHLAADLPETPARTLCLDSPAAGLAAESSARPGFAICGADAAYMIYTSGTTGRPKGAVNTHRGLLNRLLWMQSAYGLTSADRVLQKTPFGFDVSVWEFFWPLMTGARLVVARPDGHRDPAYLAGLIVREGVTALHFVPSMLQLFLEEPDVARCRSLRLVFASGEALPFELQQRFYRCFAGSGVALHNLYGPTEAAIDVTFWPCRPEGAPRVPIGRPVANTAIRILDPGLRPVALGVPGELCIGGAQLARGYFGRPELTADRFVPDPLSEEAGERLYRTGDLARFLPDGALEYLGRLDFQVKIRGVRIELGEIEGALLTHPAVREAVVVAREGLAAYVVLHGGETANPAELRTFLAEKLPEAMIPTAFAVLEELPLSANGKVDRRALPAPEAPSSGPSYAAPRTPAEQVLAALWAEVLQIGEVGRHDNFFALGGHSLLATRVVSRVRAAFGIDLPLRVLFDAPTVAGLAAAVERSLGSGASPAPPLASVPRAGDPPLSFAQQRLWFVDQLEPGNPAYNIPAAVRIEGALERAVLAASLDEVAARHESLRTTFALSHGEPVQRIAPPAPLLLPWIDLGGLPAAQRETELRRLAAEEARRPFDLSRGPLLRSTLVSLDGAAARDHVLFLTVHHIVSDGWSTGVLIREFSALYPAFLAGRPSPLPPLPVQYADFAVWQRRWLQGDVLEAQLRYWRERMAGAPPWLDLPADRPRPPVPSGHGGSRVLRLPTRLSTDLAALGRREGATPFMILLAGFDVLLHHVTGRDDLVVGTDVANRNREETEGLIGFFVNQLALRTDLSGDPPFRTLLARVREEALAAYAHQDLPFERLVEEIQPERDLARQPVFQVVFALQNVPETRTELPGLTISPLGEASGTSKMDLTVVATETPAGLSVEAAYSADLFDGSTVARLLGHFEVLLSAVAADPGLLLSLVPLLREPERHQVLTEWNDSGARFPEEPFPRFWEAQGAAAPGAVAAVCEEESWTYGELARRASGLARWLLASGVASGDPVPLIADRGLGFLAAVIGTFEAGGAYLPLEPRHPSPRLLRMIADSGARLALVEKRFAADLEEALAGLPAGSRPRLLRLEEIEREDAPWPGGRPAIAPRDLAYVLYTSGSTGLPKGALIEHRGMANHLWAKVLDLGLTAGDVLAQTASQSFDVSVWQLLATLLVGGRVHIVPDAVAHEPRRLLAEVEEGGITVLETVPSLLRLLLEDLEARSEARPALTRLRFLIATGEALPAELCRRWLRLYPGIPLVNAYGPTECSDDVTHHILRTPPVAGEAGVPIGRPVANLRLHVLGRGLLPLPAGVPGELFVGGTGVGRGYLGDGARTAPSWLPDPFADEPGARLYRTGDRAQRRPDGTLEFLGRIDQQVKIRGQRIELGEVEAALAAHPEVRAAAVALQETRLVAYVVPSGGEGLDRDRVGQWEAVFDEIYDSGEQSARDAGINLRVWISSYTGAPLPEAEIFECFEDSVSRILALRPARVLEIGCGTGLLLLRIAPFCAAYTGTDISAEVLLSLGERIAGRSDLPPVELLHRAADDFAGLPSGSFDVVVLNEVAQYFPSVEYLVQVVEGAVAAATPGGAVFLGGLRSFPLLAAFHASVELAQAPAGRPLAEVREMARRRLAQDKELAVDPALFEALAAKLPRVQSLALQLKGGRSGNELTRFRYDVVLRIAGGPEPARPEPRQLLWEKGWTLEELRRMLAQGPAALAVRGVPNARLLPLTIAFDRLRDGGPGTAGELREEIAAASGGVEPADLWDLAAELGWEAEIRGSIDDPELLDVLFHRPGTRPAWPFQARRAAAPWSRYANRPERRASDGLLPRLRAFASERLPDSMVPSAWMLLDELPLTPNGKLDRKALPALEALGIGTAGGEAPRGPVEEALAAIWAEVLGLERVGTHDDFFTLGGHSLLATQVISRLRSAFGVELPLRTLFEEPTVARLAARIGRERGEEEAPPILPVPRDGGLPLSFAQQRLWFLDLLEPGTPLYNIPAALRLDGRLDVGALERALSEVVRRHEALRTTFPEVEGQPVQAIAPPSPQTLPLLDLAALPATGREEESRRRIVEEATRPFDLARGPLLRNLLLRRGEREHVLVLTAHHVIWDGWSTGVFVRELSILYGAFSQGEGSPLAELSVQYADFSAWQRQWLSGERLERRIAAWHARLAGAPAALDLPTDRPRPALQTFRGRRLPVRLDAAASLRDLARREGATLFMALLALFQTLLSRASGQENVVVGTPIAGRNRQELEALLGVFINSLPLRGDLSGAPSFRELLHRTRDAAFEAYALQDLPFEKLVEELRPARDFARSPVFQTLLVLQNAPLEPLTLPDLSLAWLPAESGTAKFELTLTLAETGGALSGEIEYNADLFDATTVARTLAHFRNLLAGAVAGPGKPVAEFPLLAEAEVHQIAVEWNDTAFADGPGLSVHQLVAAQARRSPERVALVFEGEAMTYGELDLRAGRLARRLRSLGVGPEVLVGIAMERSLELVVAVLGALRSGGAYLPLDPSYPAERLAFMLADSGAPVLLTQPQLAASLPPHRAEVVRLELEPGWTGGEGEEGLPVAEDAALESLAYTIYTSGSTGRPKGVQVTRGNLANFLASMRREPGLGADDVLLAVTSLSFDIAALEIFLPLFVGARIELVSGATAADGPRLLARLRESGATAVQATPSTWRLLLEAGWDETAPLRLALCGGEALPADLAQSLSRRAGQVWNVYGPTETTVWSTVSRVRTGEAVSIGRPLHNTTVHLLDPWSPVPAGVAGRLFLGGSGVARGYAGRPDLTAERFRPDPGNPVPGARLYDTGDLARFLPDGRLDFLGRTDHQVKVRGFRIEPGEVEAALLAHPAVERAAAGVHGSGADRRLVAWIVPAAGEEVTLAALRDFLRERLPAYMAPTALVLLDRLPLTPNGKLDRRALPAPDGTRPGSAAPYLAPRSPVEQVLAGIWSRVLGVDRVGVLDDFFDLGGHSLLATQVLVLLRKELRVELPLRHLFERPTVSGLAALLLAEPDRRERVESIAALSVELDALSEEEIEALWLDEEQAAATEEPLR